MMKGEESMKSIYEITAKKTMAAPGMWGYDAEAKVTGPDVAEEIFVHVNMYEGFKNYVVSDKSLFGDDLCDEYIEQYEKLSEAKASAYYPVFKALNSVLSAMEKQ